MAELSRRGHGNNGSDWKLENLIPMNRPGEVLKEVEHILGLLFDSPDTERIRRVYYDISDLFHGRRPGYRACNTSFHDLQHTTDCFLSMARLLHGARIEGVELDEHSVLLGLVASLMHDTGYIQDEGDRQGTGAQYTVTHIDRSIDFLKAYFDRSSFTPDDYEFCRRCLRCTGLDVNISLIRFESPSQKIVGKMLGAADLLGQMADRTYLEKLLFLYAEFQEAEVSGFDSEYDLLQKTEAFYQATFRRLDKDLDGVYRYAASHFRERWHINRNLYVEAIERNIEFLSRLLKKAETNYRDHLKRIPSRRP